MGSSCSKRDHGTSQSREELTQTHGQTKQSKEKASKQQRMATAWFDRFSIDVESWGTSTKRILPRNTSMVSGCKYVVITRITLEKKQMPRGTIGNKRASNLNCALRLPELDWGSAQVKLQFPKLLPLNLWTGETYMFGFMQDSSQATSNVTLVGKIGNEEVHINQKVIHNPSLSTERWKRLGDILTDEMKKHNMTLTKESSKSDVKKRDSRDTGYTSMSYKYSSDASQRLQSQQNDESTDSDEDNGASFDNRRPRRHDAASHSPSHRFVQMSYKKRVEESKLVEERESSSNSKSTDDSKSRSSAEKQSLARQQSHSSRVKRHSKQSRKESETAQSELKHSSCDAQELISSSGSSETSPSTSDSQHSSSQTKKKKSVSTKKTLDISAETGAKATHLETNENENEIAQDNEDKTRWIGSDDEDKTQSVDDDTGCDDDGDDDADDESDEIDKTTLFSNNVSSKKGEIMSDRENIVRPKSLKLKSDENNTDKNYLQTDYVYSSVDKNDAVLNKRHSLSEIMEKQEKQDIAASTQQRFNIALQETAKIIENSPKARYFALHQYGSKEKKRVNLGAGDLELYGSHSTSILSYDVKEDKAHGAAEALEYHSHKETEDTAAARYSENVEGSRSQRRRKVTPVPLLTPSSLQGKRSFNIHSSIDEIHHDTVDLSTGKTLEKSESSEELTGDKPSIRHAGKEIDLTKTHTLSVDGKGEKEKKIIYKGQKIKAKSMVSDKRDSNYDTTTHKTKVAQVKSNDDVLDKGVKERSDIDHDLYTGRQKVIHKEISRRDTTEFDSNSEARIRAQTLDGSRKANTPGSKYKRVNSEEGNVGLQSNLAPTREMPSPVHEISPVSRVKEAFVYMTDEDEKQQADSEKIKRDHSNSGKPYARQIPYAGTGRKISKFYKKKSKDVKK